MSAKKLLHIVARSKANPEKNVDLQYSSVKQAKRLNNGLFDFRTVGYWHKNS